MRLGILIFGFICFCLSGLGQGQLILDSLKQRLPHVQGEERVDVLAEMAWNSMSLSLDSVEHYAQDAQHLATAIDYEKGHGFAQLYLAWVKIYQGEYNTAKQWGDQVLSLAEEKQHTKLKGRALLTLGAIENTQGFYPEALENYLNGLRALEEVGDQEWLNYAYNNIAANYNSQGNSELAIEHYIKALELFIARGDQIGQALTLGNLGGTYYSQEEFNLALEMCQEGLALAKEIEFVQMIGSNTSTLALIHMELGQLKKAKQAACTALNLFQKQGDKRNEIEVYYTLSKIYSKSAQRDSAFIYAEKGKALAQEIETWGFVHKGDLLLSVYHEKEGNIKRAFEHFKAYSKLKDSLINKENNTLIADMQVKYETEKTALELEKQSLLLQDAEQKKRNILWASLIGIAVLVLIITLVSIGYRQNKKAKEQIAKQKQEVEHQKEIVEEKNKDILDSIQYAERLQKGLMPALDHMQTSLKDMCVFFQPKDIVSGDFYWMDDDGNDVLFAAADCTGHGVPGALVSVVGCNGLQRCVNEFQLRSPGLILDKLTTLVAETFQISGQDIKDGMDIALCRLNRQENNIEFAGAHNPLWIVRKQEILVIKGDKQPVGQFEHRRPFQTHQVPVEQGDLIVLFSDGFSDQFGGPKGKKIMNKRFKQILLEHAEQPLSALHEHLKTSFETWKGNFEQVDDVCVIVVRV